MIRLKELEEWIKERLNKIRTTCADFCGSNHACCLDNLEDALQKIEELKTKGGIK